MDDRLAQGRRVAGAATLLTLLLAVAKGGVGYLRQSPALAADAVHSAADTLAILASWFGLKLASRPPTKRFPFGLYRAETLAALLVSAILFVAGARLLVEGISGLTRGAAPLSHGVEVPFVALVSAVVSFGIYLWEKRVGAKINSQSLLANADESKTDVMTSLAVFVATAASHVGAPQVELVVAIGLSVLIMWLGAKHGRTAIYVLLDASLDAELESHAAAIAADVPGVMRVEQVRLRRAGPFCFGIAHIQMRKSVDVTRAHDVAHQVAQSVRETLPEIENLTVHLEPFHPEQQTLMVPADGDGLDARVSKHFARAEFFLFAEVSPEGVTQTEWVENAFRTGQARTALDVIRDTLESRAVDAVLTHEIGEIAFHALRDAYVEVYAAPDGTVESALMEFAQHKLPLLAKPTHASQGSGSPRTLREDSRPTE